MSLLEDIFLENEAGEAQELERIIEGDDFDERPRSRSDSDENSAKEDEAEEEKTRVDPTSAKPKRVIKNPRFVLNPARLTGPRGIQVVTEHFKDFKFKGKGHEKEDLDLVLKKLEHWAYRLYPKFQFVDCLKKIETLGKKRPVAVHLHRIRMDQISSEETVVQKDSSDDEAPAQEPEEDEFDKLLKQQIEIARATPAPGSVKKTPFSERSSMMPKASSSPSINDEQRERMLKNRRMAEERRLAKLKQNTSEDNIENGVSESQTIIDVSMENKQRSVIESSDEDVTNDSNKRDTVEIDIDVTKSPKCYVRAKKHKSDNAMNRSVTIDSHNSNNVILELDDDGKIVSEPKKYIPAKKHNKSRIDSSDDDTEDDALVNECIDTQNTNKLSSKMIQNSIDLNEDPVINNIDHHQHNRPTMDSSESEDEAVVMNESISVDIHGSNIHVTNDTNTRVTCDSNAHVTNDSNTPDTSIKSDTTKNDIASLKETVENNDEIIECGNDKNSDDQNAISFWNSNVNINDNTTKVHSIESDISNDNLTTPPQNHIEIDVNEIMDVDFSDDF